MNSTPARRHEEEAPKLLAEYIAEHGLPPGVNLPSEVIPQLTPEEQQATIEACEALAAGDEEAGARLNELWEDVWDRLEMPGFEAALAEAEEKGTIPLREYMKSRGIPCTPSE
jgi:hypothetical protein